MGLFFYRICKEKAQRNEFSVPKRFYAIKIIMPNKLQ